MPTFIDLSGRKFGRLTVIGRDHNNRKNKIVWKCKCECGKELLTVGWPLTSYRTRSCGCLHDETHLVDMVGEVYNRLTVIKRQGSAPGSATWLCQCTCGNTKVTTRHCLVHGNVQSCGCLLKENQRKATLTHGMSKTPIYKIWASMKARCSNPNVYGYKNYGGRGIKVCDRWQTFENFRADIGERPPRTSLDRINVNGHYEPKNCRWASYKEQRQNNQINQEVLDLKSRNNSLQRQVTILKSENAALHARLAQLESSRP